MATQPQTIHIVLKTEKTRGACEPFPTVESEYFIRADEAEVVVERDWVLRCEAADDPASVERRSVQEIFKELSKDEYNNAKKHLRHTSYRSASGTDSEVETSLVEVASSTGVSGFASAGDWVDPTESWVMSARVHEVLADLDPIDRFVLIGICLEGYTQMEMASVLGVSQPMVQKRLKRAKKAFEVFSR